MNKTIIMLIIFLIFCASQLIAAECGDVNSDSEVTIVDALLTAQFYVGSNPKSFDKSAADVSGDSKINIVDALLMAQYYVGQIHNLSGCSSRIVNLYPIGDSITSARNVQSSWRYWLWKALVEAGHNKLDFVGSANGTGGGTSDGDIPWDMDHEGHSGWSAAKILNKIDVWAPKYKAEIAMIHLGTNDIRGKRKTTDIIQTFKEIIKQLRKVVPTVKIVICQIPYWKFSKYGGSKAQVDDLNAALPSLVQYGPVDVSPIKIVDIFTDFFWETDNADGIHPSPSGAKKISDRLFPVVDAWLKGN